MKKNNILIVLLGYLFISGFPNYFIFAAEPLEDLKSSVVKLTVADSQRNLQEGAGIIISESGGGIYILTNYHVIEDAIGIVVHFYKHPTLKRQAVAYEKVDIENDLAVVYIPNSRLPKNTKLLTLGNSSDMQDLDEIRTIGHPRGHEWELSSGELRRAGALLLRFSGDAVDPGNSGGALINSENELIGIDYTTAR